MHAFSEQMKIMSGQMKPMPDRMKIVVGTLATGITN
jgi:hypothetical protein